MFKIPEWGDDVPKTNIDVKKLLPGKRNSKSKKNKVQTNVTLKNNSKLKNKSKPIINGKISKLKNKNGKNNKKQTREKVSPKSNNVQKKTDKQPTTNQFDIKNCDTDKLDEVILDAKKQKLVDSYMKEDNEESLFTEKSETNINNNNINKSPAKTGKQKKQLNQSKINTSNTTEVGKKRKNTSDLEIETKSGKNKRKKNTKGINNETNSSENSNGNLNIGKQGRERRNINITKESVKEKENNSRQNSNNVTKLNKNNRKKELLRNMLESHRNHINIGNNGNKLRERMLEKLNAAKFRFLNEKLYTSSGSEAQKLFKEDPAAFQTYHQGYQQQVKKWPVNPLDVVVRKIKSLPKTHLIADMGCGEAALTKRVPHSVRSFDLVATAPDVEVCDMAHTPLLSDSMNVVVFCLALMGTDLTQYLVEANRVLKMGGNLLIAEVESRFDDVDSFAKEVQKLGFTLRKLDKTHKVFYFMEFTKAREAPSKKSKLPELYLKPCIYKKR